MARIVAPHAHLFGRGLVQDTQPCSETLLATHPRVEAIPCVAGPFCFPTETGHGVPGDPAGRFRGVGEGVGFGCRRSPTRLHRSSLKSSSLAEFVAERGAGEALGRGGGWVGQKGEGFPLEVGMPNAPVSYHVGPF